MKKASKKLDYNYESIFPRNLQKLMDDNKVTQEDIAKACNVQRQSVSQWRNGNTRPDILSLQKIADFFNVSTDYLLGRESGTTHEISTLMDELKLSELSIKHLRTLSNSRRRALEMIIRDDVYNDDFSILDLYSRYLYWERMQYSSQDLCFSIDYGGMLKVEKGLNEAKPLVEFPTHFHWPTAFSLCGMQLEEVKRYLRLKIDNLPTERKFEIVEENAADLDQYTVSSKELLEEIFTGDVVNDNETNA